MSYKSIISMLVLLLVGAVQLPAKRDSIPVPIIVDRPGSTPIARTPSPVHFVCAVETDLNVVLVASQGLHGITEARIENRTTGETFYDEWKDNASLMIPISGTSGLWLVTFTLENGVEYVGEFEL